MRCIQRNRHTGIQVAVRKGARVEVCARIPGEMTLVSCRTAAEWLIKTKVGKEVVGRKRVSRPGGVANADQRSEADLPVPIRIGQSKFVGQTDRRTVADPLFLMNE